MKTNYFKNYKKSYNSFNPFNYYQTINPKKINGNSLKMTIESNNTKKGYKKNLWKKQGINFNSSEIIQYKKNSKNFDKYNNNKENNIKQNYTQKVTKVKNKVKIPVESEISLSRNFNQLNGNSLCGETMSSFSLTNNLLSYNSQNKKMEYDIDKLIETGIKYCFDEDGNPMDILDIKIKNKNPIAFIIQTANKNILMDTNNKIIIPNNTGDYTLPHKPYIIIHKYDVLHPELRVIKPNNKDDSINNDNIFDFKNSDRRKNNKSSNLFDVDFKVLNGVNNMNENRENKNDNYQLFSPIVKSKINIYNNLNKNIKSQKRKYIFVNRLNEFNNSIQLKLNRKEDKTNSITRIKTLLNDNTLNDKYFNQKEFSTINNDNKNNNKNNSQYLNKTCINKLLSNTSTNLKEIKHISEQKLNNTLEFKFERKYKSIHATINQEENNTSKNEIKETPNKKEDNKLFDNFNSIQTTTNFHRAKKILNLNPKLELNKFKRQRYSYSLNEFMFNPIINPKQISNNKNKNNNTNKMNILSPFNKSLFTPISEKTAYSTIQKTYNELDNNNTLKKSNVKNSLNNKYYLKPKIKSSKFFHKRINTENFNTGKNLEFLQSIEINNKNNNNNYISPFTLTESDFKVNNKTHNSNCNTNTVCKCPFCHNLFYS